MISCGWALGLRVAERPLSGRYSRELNFRSWPASDPRSPESRVDAIGR